MNRSDIDYKEANNSEDTTINLESDDKITLVLNKCNPDNFIVLIGKELFPKDRDIYFVAFDGTPYKAKKRHLNLSSVLVRI